MRTKGNLIIGVIFIIASVLLLIFLLKLDIFEKEFIEFKTTETVSGLSVKQTKGVIRTSPYVLLFWPVLFFLSGLLALQINKKLKHLFFGLIFFSLGSLFLVLKAPFRYSLIALTFIIIGLSFIIGFIRKL